MNRILFEKQQGRYTLDPRDSRFEHVRGVLRMGPGDYFDVGVINGPAGKAEIVDLEKDSLSIRVEWGERPSLPPDVHLIIGMCRPATVKKILTTVPTLGVRSLHFVQTGRTDPAYARSGIWKDQEWRARLIEGVEQAFDTYLPDVRIHPSLEDGLADLPPTNVCLALDVYEGISPLSSVAVTQDRPVLLAVGPERGWNGRDRQLLMEKGFSLHALNDRILRVETAVVVGLTLLFARMGIY